MGTGRMLHDSESPAHDLLEDLAQCFLDARHFSVMEVQVWWGQEALRMPSHMDGVTSLLHLGLTLGGRRWLRAGIFATADTLWSAMGYSSLENDQHNHPSEPSKQAQRRSFSWGPPEKNVWADNVWRPENLQNFCMTQGCAYLSSPFCFEHAVEYEVCDENFPVIAIQCRWAFPPEIGTRWNTRRTSEMRQVSGIIAEVLRQASERSGLVMP